jgi:hypothetical protein
VLSAMAALAFALDSISRRPAANELVTIASNLGL